ncbi:MAG: succinate--CoA ligase subunit alpha [Firmicutes bacterium]|nr:succinate--CoA ligase subunit alpha [Bacillota bacterium]
MLSKGMNVLVQGITGKEAGFWVERMVEYGTKVPAGVAPGRGGTEVQGIPVYDSVQEAVSAHKIDASIMFIAPRLVESAVFEAVEAGIKLIVVLADGVPVHDTMKIMAYAEQNGARIIGPNTPGLVFPGDSLIGIMPSWLPHVFKPGSIGVVTRSGSLGNEVCFQIVQAGFGISNFVGIGGDLLIGTTTVEVLKEFESCPETKGIVVVGELGGNMEEQAAQFIPEMTKPVVALIGGKTAPQGVSMGHAGAIVEGTAGSVESKQKILAENGAHIADTPFDIGRLLKELLA